MLKKLLYSLLFITVATASEAQNTLNTYEESGKVASYSFNKKMVIHYWDGGYFDVMLNEEPIIKYDVKPYFTILNIRGESLFININLSDIKKITYEDVAATIEDISIVSKYSGPSLVYDINGRHVMTVPEGQQVMTSSLPQGMYVIKNNNHSYKIQKR